jgi:hypothetical protein
MACAGERGRALAGGLRWLVGTIMLTKACPPSRVACSLGESPWGFRPYPKASMRPSPVVAKRHRSLQGLRTGIAATAFVQAFSTNRLSGL